MTTAPTTNGHHSAEPSMFGALHPDALKAAAKAYHERRAADQTVTAGSTRATLADPPATQAPVAHWADDLREWWNVTADRDISTSLPKIVEYGGDGPAYDLLATGHDLAAMNGRRVSDEEAVEIAICFYLSSKLNRWMAAVIDGRRPSDDTLLDCTYYAMMARRNRAVGGWPTA